MSDNYSKCTHACTVYDEILGNISRILNGEILRQECQLNQWLFLWRQHLGCKRKITQTSNTLSWPKQFSISFVSATVTILLQVIFPGILYHVYKVCHTRELYLLSNSRVPFSPKLLLKRHRTLEELAYANSHEWIFAQQIPIVWGRLYKWYKMPLH